MIKAKRSVSMTIRKGIDYITVTPTAEIDICLNCLLPDCKKDRCARFAEEVKKIPNRRRRKR